MGDQPVTRQEFDSLTAAINALMTHVASLTTRADNTTTNNNNRNNLNKGGVPVRVRNNNHTIKDSISKEEEVVTEEGDECGNHHDYRVKAYNSSHRQSIFSHRYHLCH